MLIERNTRLSTADVRFLDSLKLTSTLILFKTPQNPEERQIVTLLLSYLILKWSFAHVNMITYLVLVVLTTQSKQGGRTVNVHTVTPQSVVLIQQSINCHLHNLDTKLIRTSSSVVQPNDALLSTVQLYNLKTSYLTKTIIKVRNFSFL